MNRTAITIFTFLQITATPTAGTIAVKFKIPGSNADNKVLNLVPDTADEYCDMDLYTRC